MVFIKKIQKECGVYQVLLTSFPIVIAMLSGVLMSVLDRALLARYSLHAMNSVSFVNNFANVILLPLLSFSGISEIFVGQFNGAKSFKKTSQPVGQISLFLIGVWAILTPFVIHYFLRIISSNHFEEGIPYFLISVFLIPFQIIFSAVAGFFVGTRRPMTTLYGIIASNIVNLILDLILIFGIKDWIPAMGATGAGIASLIAMMVATGIMLTFFLSGHNAKIYNTRAFSFSWPLLQQNIVLGLPYAVCDVLEMSFWSFVLVLLGHISSGAVTVHNLSVILWVFLTFVTEGLQKGVMALASNCIGAHQESLIVNLIRSLFKIAFGVAVITFIPLLIYPEKLLHFIFDMTDPRLIPVFRTVFLFVWGEIVVQILSFSCLSGILSSGGDTAFVMKIKLLNLGFCMALPLFIYYHFDFLDAVTSWKLSFLSQIINLVCFYARYRSGKWKHQVIAP